MGHTPAYRLVVGANRDELYGRPTAPAAFWPDAPAVLAGRDLEAGGTWLGVTRGLRFAAVTNFRDPTAARPGARSRGELTRRFLTGDAPAAEYMAEVHRHASAYNGFNLFVADASGLFYYSNRDGEVRELGAGTFGLSNHLLDTPWPKVAELKPRFLAALGAPLDAGAIRDILADRAVAPDSALPDTGVGLERERMLSPAFVVTESYGTRSTTVLALGTDRRVEFSEWSYAAGGVPAPGGTRAFAFAAE
ncbi:MAG: NRDE family protein [Burkholderiales bacterium]|nr:NRDE family protein [Burkholderiales bacterium]